VLVRYARLYEQTTVSSRTVLFAGASPDFIRPTPLSARLLITIFSVQFQKFQALLALDSSYSHNALAGNFTLLLQVTLETDRCDPGHLSLLCIPLDRFLPVSCIPAVYDAFAPRLARPDYVCAFCRASAPYHGSRWRANGQASLPSRISRARTDGQGQWSQARALLNESTSVFQSHGLAHNFCVSKCAPVCCADCTAAARP
jgi:hypothetical protein